MKIRASLPAALVLVWLCAGAQGAVDSIYQAGKMAGVTLYWVPKAPIEPDTIAWGTLQGVLTPTERLEYDIALGQAATNLAEHDYALFTIKDCEALALALLSEMDYHICALTQWHGSLKNEVIIAKPGMPTEAKRHSLISDMRWEKVERTQIEKAASRQADEEFDIKVYFVDNGMSQYAGKELLVGSSDQIQGTKGFGVNIPELSFSEDVTIARKVFQLCLVAPIAAEASDIVTALEKAMDGHKIDISYKVPRFIPVKRAPKRQTEPDALPAPEPNAELDTKPEDESDAAPGTNPGADPDADQSAKSDEGKGEK